MRGLRPATSARLLSGVLVVTGTTHFLLPRSYDGLIPPALPGPARWWTYGSGVAELGCAALLAVPRTRRVGGVAAAVLFVGVLPGNAWMAWQWRHRGAVWQAVGYARLPLQAPLVWWALYCRREASG